MSGNGVEPGDGNISEEVVTISEELEALATRLRNSQSTNYPDLAEIADRLDVIRGMLDGPVEP